MWTIEKLNGYIVNQVEESLHLDYKAADALTGSKSIDAIKKEIAKDVSAFANSDGGVIIYGISENSDPVKKHLPESLDPLLRTSFSKERLEQIINSNISPKIQGLRIHSISISIDKVIYVVVIPKSNTAHMVTAQGDKRYYKRYNFMAESMDAYEVQDVMNRSSHSSIKIECVIIRPLITSYFPKNMIGNWTESAKYRSFRGAIWGVSDYAGSKSVAGAIQGPLPNPIIALRFTNTGSLPIPRFSYILKTPMFLMSTAYEDRGFVYERELGYIDTETGYPATEEFGEMQIFGDNKILAGRNYSYQPETNSSAFLSQKLEYEFEELLPMQTSSPRFFKTRLPLDFGIECQSIDFVHLSGELQVEVYLGNPVPTVDSFTMFNLLESVEEVILK